MTKAVADGVNKMILLDHFSLRKKPGPGHSEHDIKRISQITNY